MAGETEVLGESLPQCRFLHLKPHMLPGREPATAVGTEAFTAGCSVPANELWATHDVKTGSEPN
jgi:hypothetical protein